MMSNLRPSTWRSDLPRGPLGNVVVWAPALVLAWGEGIRKLAFLLIGIDQSRSHYKIEQ